MSIVEIGNTATAAQYNDLRTRIINAAAQFGISLATIEVYLGTSMPAKVAGDAISNEDWDKLYVIVYWLRFHQKGVVDPGLPPGGDFFQWNQGEPILAGDGYEYSVAEGVPVGALETDKGYNDISEAIYEAENTPSTHAANQFTLVGANGTSADTSTPTWGGGTNGSTAGGSAGDQLAGDNSRGMIERTFSVTWSSVTARDTFFALGGEATFFVRMTNSNGVPLTSAPSGTKANWWYTHLNVDNPISFILAGNIFDVLTTSYQQFQEKTDSNNALYSMNRTRISLRKNSANTRVDVKVQCFDYDRAITEWPDAPVDEDVGQRVATYVSLKQINASTNPLFNTVGSNPSISAGSWSTNAITDQPALAVGPDPFSASFSGAGTAGSTTKNIGTFDIPADRWTLSLQSTLSASGYSASGLLSSSSASSGNCRIIIRDGSYSGTIVYDTGLQLGISRSNRGTVIYGLILKTAAAAKTYYVQFQSTENGADAFGSIVVKGSYNGPA